jgi:hypothetical protein
VVRVYNPSIWKAEAGASYTLEYIYPVSKKKKNQFNSTLELKLDCYNTGMLPVLPMTNTTENIGMGVWGGNSLAI